MFKLRRVRSIDVHKGPVDFDDALRSKVVHLHQSALVQTGSEQYSHLPDTAQLGYQGDQGNDGKIQASQNCR